MSNDSSELVPASTQKQVKKADPFWRVTWGAPGALLGVMLIMMFSFGVVGLLTKDGLYTSNLALGAIYSLSSVLTLGACYYFLFLKHMSLRQFLGNKIKWHTPLLVLGAYLVYMQLSWIAMQVAQQFFTLQVDQEQSFGFSDTYTGFEKLVIFLALVVLAPIAEEVLYRGILYRGLRRSWGRVLAAIVTSALFGLLHGQWNVAVDTFVLSLVLIALMEFTKSMWAPIGLHSLKNFIAFLVVFSGLISR